MHQMIDIISANAYIVAGQVGGRAGMVGDYHNFIADLKVCAAVNMQLSYFLGQAVNSKLRVPLYSTEALDRRNAMRPLIEAAALRAGVAYEKIIRRMRYYGSKHIHGALVFVGSFRGELDRVVKYIISRMINTDIIIGYRAPKSGGRTAGYDLKLITCRTQSISRRGDRADLVLTVFFYIIVAAGAVNVAGMR